MSKIDWDNLSKYADGLIATSACSSGPIPRAISDGDYEKAKSIALEFAELFPNRFFLKFIPII